MREALTFTWGVFKDNYENHLVPLCMSFIIPIMAYYFDQLNMFVVLAAFWTFTATWISMLNRDMAMSFKAFIYRLENAMGEMVAERIRLGLQDEDKDAE